MENRKRKIAFSIRLSQEENEFLKTLMDKAGSINRENFIRTLIFEKYVLRVNLNEIKQLLYLQGNISNNINQIAKKLNMGGAANEQDIEYLKKSNETLLKEILNLTKQLKNI